MKPLQQVSEIDLERLPVVLVHFFGLFRLPGSDWRRGYHPWLRYELGLDGLRRVGEHVAQVWIGQEARFAELEVDLGVLRHVEVERGHALLLAAVPDGDHVRATGLRPDEK